MATLTYSGKLTVLTCWCGIAHAIPSQLRDQQLKDGVTAVYCPLGHQHVPGRSLVDERKEMAEKLAGERRRRQAAQELLAAEERSHSATRGHLTRTKKRVGHGVCPCCNRTFQQLSRHMAAKHPGYAENGASA